MLTQDFIDNELISSTKQILKSDKQRMWLENRHYRNNFILESCDKKYSYRAFLRYSDEFIEDFSVGLIWTNAVKYINVNKPIILLRCQGPHDSGKPLGADIHHSFHTHEITPIDIIEHRYIKPSNKGITKEFSSFQSALFYFLSRCNIINSQAYIDFGKAAQMTLSDLALGGEIND